MTNPQTTLDTLINKVLIIDTLILNKKDSVSMINSTISQSQEPLILGMPEGFARIFIPVAVTIITFSLGHFLSWMKGKSEKRREIKSYKNLISKWIALMQKPIETLTVSCDEFGEQLEKAEDMTPIRFAINKLQADKMDSLPPEKFISTFSVNTTGDSDKNDRMIFNIINQFSYLKHVEVLIEKSIESYQGFFDELVKQWNHKYSEFSDIITIKSNEVGKNKNHPDFAFHSDVLDIINISIKTAPKDRKSIKHLNEKLLIPLTNRIIRELEGTQSDYAYKLSRIVGDLRIEIFQWEGAKNANAVFLKNTSKKIKYAYSKLVEASSHFKTQTKTVNIFRIK